MTQIERLIQGLAIIQKYFPDVEIQLSTTYILTTDYTDLYDSQIEVWEWNRLDWLGWEQKLGRWAFNTKG